MICQFQEQPGQPCPNEAVLIPMLEFRTSWADAALLCELKGWATCAQHMLFVRLVDVLTPDVFKNSCDTLQQNGQPRPNVQFTTLAWKPIVQLTTPPKLQLYN